MGLNLEPPTLLMRDDLRAQMPRGTVIHLDGDEEDIQNTVLTTSMNKVISWARRNSIWPVTFGL